MTSDWNIETTCLHAGQVPDPATGSRAVPIYQTTSFVFKDTEHAANLFALKEFGNIYTRLMNPTTDVLEKRLAAMDGGTAGLATSAGMSAIFLTIHTLAGAGDHIVSSTSLYGGTDTLFRFTLPRMGIETTLIEDITPEKVREAIRENTKAVYFETIGNPKGDVPDIAAIAEVAHAAGVPVVVDNTFAPVLCRPGDHGVDIVVYSCTKWIGGHGTSIGGALVDMGSFDWSSGRFPDFTEPDESYHGLKYWEAFGNLEGMGNVAFALKARVQGLRNIGMCMSPFNAFMFLQGMETLPLRVVRHSENSLALAEFLDAHEAVDWVSYTGLPAHPSHELGKKYLKGGFGSVFMFGLKGGRAAGERFVNALELTSHLANVGDAKTLALHPGSTTHQQLSDEDQIAAGVLPEAIRVAVGIENADDIIADFDQAIRKASA